MNTDKIKNFDELTEDFFKSQVTADEATAQANQDELDFAMDAINNIVAQRNVIIQSDEKTDNPQKGKRSAIGFVFLLILIFLFVSVLVFISLIYFKVDIAEIIGRITSLVTTHINNIFK